MSIDTAITRFRARQAEQFSDEATVSRPVGELVTDPDTGAVTQPYDTIYEDRPCKIRPAGHSGNDVTAGETELRMIGMTGKFAVDDDIRKDDILTVTASLYDASMPGRQYRVTEAPADAWQIARVVGLEEALVPELNPESS
jgi:hypothetical protein